MFAAAIHLQASAYPVNYRMDMNNASVERLELPEACSRALNEMIEKLVLAYAAVDLRRTPSGDDVFLELNPSGQWLFIEARTGQRITDRVTEFLQKGK